MNGCSQWLRERSERNPVEIIVMSIFYNPMTEAWEDEEDATFHVGMTPEGDGDDLEKEFKTQDEFFEWYRS